MRIPPQVSDRVKEAPAHVLRAVFAGVGQVLLVADRVRTRTADNERARASATAQPNRPARPARPAQPQAAPARPAPAPTRVATRWRSLDQTGNVRLLSRDEQMEEEEPAAAAAQPETAAEPAGETPAVAGPEPPATEPEPAETPAAASEAPVAEPAIAAEEVAATPAEQPSETGLSVLPVANYDGLTIASLRARLRNLDPAQLRVLIDYEKAHAGRGDVLTMFERRIAKLENEA
jgi:hypothetical protein